MRLHRFLLAVALCGAAAGCSKVVPQWSDPDPPSASEPAEGERDPAPRSPDPTRRHSLEVTADTLFFLEGVLPLDAADGTTAALSGPMYVRGQCDDGSMTVVVNGPAGTKRTAVRCDGAPHERALGKVEVGDALSVTATGKAGTDFAIELTVK